MSQHIDLPPVAITPFKHHEVLKNHEAIDPYVELEQYWDPSPEPGQLPEKHNTLSISVPSDNSRMVMGMDDVPGVSLSADTHVSLAAKVADSSLSVGDNSPHAADDGISLKTDGKLTEFIRKGRLLIVGSEGSEEDITGPRKTTNTGNWDQMVNGKLTIHTTEARTDTVDSGDYGLTVATGNIKVTVPAGNVDIQCPAGEFHVLCKDKQEMTLGKTKKISLADFFKFDLGCVFKLSVGQFTNINASIVNNAFAMKNEYCLNENKWVTFNKKDVGMFISTAALITLLHTTEIQKSQINLKTTSAYISSANITVMK